MGWTDNGKIMPPWITLSEQRETKRAREGRGRDAGTESGPSKKLCSRVLRGIRERDGERIQIGQRQRQVREIKGMYVDTVGMLVWGENP